MLAPHLSIGIRLDRILGLRLLPSIIAVRKNGLEIVMPDLESDFRKLTIDARQMAEENARLRKINSQMISALEYVLPLLQQGLPATVDFDWTKEAVAKVQDALAEGERD